MTKKLITHWPLLLVLALLSPLWLNNLGIIPFHPDESSVLFQSRDLETLVQSPASLMQGSNDPSPQMEQYRALNAPLAKYSIGLGRRLFGIGPEEVSVDWDWQASWDANLQQGAMPPLRALIGGRFISSLLALLAVIWLYWAGSKLGGMPYGLAAAALYGLNSLALLHGRRAMAEGTLLFTISLLIALSFSASRWPWAAGIGCALAVSAKHSALPLIVMPLLGGIWSEQGSGLSQRYKRNLAVIIALFMVVLFIFNPFSWPNPIKAAVTTLEARQNFVAEQVAVTEALAPGASLRSLPQRVASLLGHTYLLPLQFQEVGNYRSQLAAASGDYKKVAVYNLLAGGWQGALRLGLMLFGIWGAFRSSQFEAKEKRLRFFILAAGTIALVGATITLNPLPYQRYYLPLLPLLVLWEAAGVIMLANGLRAAVPSRLHLFG